VDSRSILRCGIAEVKGYQVYIEMWDR